MPLVQKKGKFHKLRWLLNKRLIPALIFIAVLYICFTIVGIKVNDIVTQAGYVMLKDTASWLSEELVGDMARNAERLKALAAVLGKYDSPVGAEAQTLLNSFHDECLISELGVLLPDNIVRLSGGRLWNANMDFTAESQLGSHISSAKDDSGRGYVCQSEPIKRDGTVIGILYEFTDAGSLSVNYGNRQFYTFAEFCVINAYTGDYLLTTGEEQLENIFSDTDRIVAEPARLKEDFTQGREGNTVFYSNIAERSLYAYYIPTGVGNLVSMLLFPEDVLFETAKSIRHFIDIMAIAEIFLFIIYIGWLMFKNYQQSMEKERQIAQISGMLDIQETLFDAHKTPGRLSDALMKTANKLTAQTAFLIPADNFEGVESYIWPQSDNTHQKELEWDVIQKEMPESAKQLLTGYSVLIDVRNRKHRPAPQDAGMLVSRKVRSLILVPIFDLKQDLVGVLGSANMQHKWDNTDFLDSIAHNFMMALENIHSYRIIEEMGTIDALTGLLNRNSYQMALEESRDVSGCVYLDANGLHDLNNTYGHAAGDAMLKAVAEALKDAFGAADSYRIGGDEYVALCRGLTREDAMERCERLEKRVDAQGYHVSVGFAFREVPPKTSAELNALVSEAEKLMYDAKNRYYEKLGSGAKPRNMPDVE